ncbi:FAD-dependent oxidoreductase [Escherichia coli]
MQSVDVAIVGGGMVGLAVACGLQGSGLRVAVLEQSLPQALAATRHLRYASPPSMRAAKSCSQVTSGRPLPPTRQLLPRHGSVG